MAVADSDSHRPDVEGPDDEDLDEDLGSLLREDTGDTDGTGQSRSPEGTQETPRARGAGFTSGAILLFLAALALIVVTVQNTDNVEFEFLWLDVSTPLVVVVMVAIAATIVIDEVVGFFWRRRRRIRRQERDELRRLRKQH